jgi:hypothetical protein
MVTQADFKEAREFAKNYGVKALGYGPPGSGKTPIMNTAPRPCLLAVEPGLLSMATSTVPTYQAPTWAKIDDWFKWLFNSAETRNYDTAGVDSVSQMCEIYLRDNPKKVQHGLKLYGLMAEEVGDILHKLYYLQNKHTYLICKQTIERTEGDGGKRKPYFPGNDLNVKVPHLYDEIIDIGIHSVPSVGLTRSFQCHSSFDSYCRDRTGKLNQFEPPDLSALFAKCMSNS